MITTTGNWNVVIWKAIEKTITAQHLGMDNNNQQRTDSQLYKIAFDCYVKNMLFFFPILSQLFGLFLVHVPDSIWVISGLLNQNPSIESFIHINYYYYQNYHFFSFKLFSSILRKLNEPQ